MQFVDGRVSMFLYGTNGMLKGFLLGRGKEVRFCVTRENVRAVRQIATMSSQVEAQCDLETDAAGEQYLQALQITNLDSKRSASLPASICQGKSGMLSAGAPQSEASLNHCADAVVEEQRDAAGTQTRSDGNASAATSAEGDSNRLRPGSYFHCLIRQNDAEGLELARYEAARSIGLAFDSLHRIQAILAYLHIMKYRVPGISQFLDEAKHTYEQSLSRFTTCDYPSAKEFGEASVSLSQVVEIVMARTLRSDASLPSLVPPPPHHLHVSREAEHVEENLAQAESVLSRIHWVLENGTLPSEDRAQVRKIAGWGDAFYKQAQHKYRDTVVEDAAEFAQAALAGAHSAEHVCRKWYVSHPVHP
jgi:hypothetical protein